VGLSTVQGLALATGRPCYAACTLDVLAERIDGAAPYRVAMMDAFRSEIYAARYDAAGQRADGPLVTAPEPWLRTLPPGCAFVGDAVDAQRALIEAVCTAPVFPRRSLFLAATLARLGERALAAGKGVNAAELRPVYLREPTVRGSVA
jgi:tRNA threonylcarbamoyladenosine biosynthesis protein TsaB